MWYCLLHTVIYQDFVTLRKSNEHHWEGRASGNFTTSITRAGSWVRALSFSFVCSSRQKWIRLHRGKGKKADSLRPYLVNKTIWDFRKFARIWVTTREEDSVVTAGSIDQLKDVSRSVLRWRNWFVKFYILHFTGWTLLCSLSIISLHCHNQQQGCLRTQKRTPEQGAECKRYLSRARWEVELKVESSGSGWRLRRRCRVGELEHSRERPLETPETVGWRLTIDPESDRSLKGRRRNSWGLR